MINTERMKDRHIFEVMADIRQEDRAEIGPSPVIRCETLTHGASIALALTVNDKAIAIGGIREKWPLCGEAWLIASKSVVKYPISLHKVTLYLMTMASRFHRVECMVHEDNHTALKWTEAIGFEMECKMKKYDSAGADYYLYARVK